MRLIGVTGYATAGKDAVGKALAAHGYQRIAFADKLREAALALDPLIVSELTHMDRVLMPSYPTADLFQNRAGQTVRIRRLSEVVREKDGPTPGAWVNAKQDPEVRRTLQRIGTEVGREVLGPDTWIDALLGSLDLGRYVVTDVRFLNEAEGIRSRGGQVWRVVRPGVGPANDHASEREQEQITADAVIYNNGTLADLEAKVAAELPSLMERHGEV